MKISNAFPSKYLQSSDLKKPDGTPATPTVIIDRFVIETFTSGEKGCVLYFQGRQKGLSLNKTKSTIIAASYGDETDAWTGRPVTLSVGQTLYQGRQYEIINVTVPQGPARPAPAPQTYTPPTQQAPDPMSFEDQQNEGCNDVDDDAIPEGW